MIIQQMPMDRRQTMILAGTKISRNFKMQNIIYNLFNKSINFKLNPQNE